MTATATRTAKTVTATYPGSDQAVPFTKVDPAARVWPGTPYALRIEASRPLTDAEAHRLAALTGYAWAATIAGESLGWRNRTSDYQRDTPASLIFWSADSTKSRRDDLGMAFEEFCDQLPTFVSEGTPIRKTNRAGAGTKGTRLIDGLGKDVTVSIWLDDVFTD